MVNNVLYKIADWMSGGEITSLTKIANESFNDAYQKTRRLHKSNSALMNIIALETPNANATVRKMVRIAKDGLQ